MKIVVISDIHGKGIWKKIVRHNKSTLFIFLGDYFDSLSIPFHEQMNNFKDIITYKRENQNKVLLLFGNHDYHYLPGIKERYSGYQKLHASAIENEISKVIDIFQICYIHNKFLFSHAGITKTWCKDNNININNLEQSINNLFKINYRPFGFNLNSYDNTGDDICQGPLWVRPHSLIEDMIEGYTQIIGHTRISAINITDSGIILTDVFDTRKEYLQIIDDIPSVNQTK